MFSNAVRSRISQISFVLLVVFYLFAGFNHFRDPEFYYPLIPPYFKYIYEINILAGLAEVLLAIGLTFKSTRKGAAYGIIIMLLAFIPAHIYFIQLEGCLSESLCVPSWVAWVRLLVVHPMLIGWVWVHRS
jgi:uncharacterized membrane protein